jgi:hyaluronan synthase
MDQREIEAWLITFAGFGVILLIALCMNLRSWHISKIKFHKSPLQRKEKTAKDSQLLTSVISVSMLLLLYHWYEHFDDTVYYLYPLFFVMICSKIFFMSAAHFNKPYIGEPAPLRTMVVVPVYNEDIETFRMVLDGISRQTLLPTHFAVIEDGSSPENRVEEAFNEWHARNTHINAHYELIENSGKRIALSKAFIKHRHDADIFITLDSDSILKEDALEKGLIPFNDPQINCVSGLLVPQNSTNVLTRVIGIGFISAFTNGRSSWSLFESLGVSCGGLAFYRSEIVTKHLKEFTTQTVLGNTVISGDDRMLTQYASLYGKTVYQESAVAFTAMPENIFHFTRQRVRWGKNFWWGSAWQICHQSIRNRIWWLTYFKLASFVLFCFAAAFIFVIFPLLGASFPTRALLCTVIISLICELRTMTVPTFEKRRFHRLKTILSYPFLAIASMALNVWASSILRIYALTHIREVSTWGTRATVEVTQHT